MIYTDLATYTNDTMALLAEAPTEYKLFNDVGVAICLDESKVCKIQTLKNGSESVSIVRADAQLLATIKGMSTIMVLSEVPMGGDIYAAMSQPSKAIWDRVRGPLLIVVDNGDGTTTNVNTPVIPSIFA